MSLEVLMRGFALFCFFVFINTPVLAEPQTIRAIVSDSNAPPYAIFDAAFDHNLQLTGGISKDILEALAQRSQLSLQFLALPRGRVEQWLLKDQADIACFLNPDWVTQPSTLLWSEALFTTRQVLVRQDTQPAITQISDLLGKRIGTDRGFSYPEFDSLFAQQSLIRDDANSLQSNLIRLQKARVDAVLTVDLAYHYYQLHHNSERLIADLLWTTPDAIYCAFSPNNPELATKMQQTLQHMIADGTIQHILQRYKPNPLSSAAAL